MKIRIRVPLYAHPFDGKDVSTYKASPKPYRFPFAPCGTGSPQAIALSLAPAQAPLYSYAKQTYTPVSAAGNLDAHLIWGKLTSLTINVTAACAAAGTCVLNPLGQFHYYTVKISDGTKFDYIPVINLKQPGERIITVAGVTCDGVPGSCSGDSALDYSAQGDLWFGNSVNPFMGSTHTSAPTFSIEVVSDQGVVNP